MRDSSLSPSSRLGGAVISDRIVSALLEELRTGRYAQTDRLPAEVDLAAELGVSRTVIRDALSEMERAGYIERVRGIGTVVNRSVLNLRSRLDQKLEYYPLIRSFGSYPHADGIQIYPVRAGEELARDLAIEPGDDVICIKKRILADTTPVIYSIDYLPRALFGNRDYTRIDLTGDKVAMQRLKEAAEKAKIELSGVTSSNINLPYITADATGPLSLIHI